MKQIDELSQTILNANNNLGLILDCHYNILAVNDAVLHRFPNSKNDYVGKNFFDLFNWENVDMWKAHFQIVLSSGTKLSFQVVENGDHLHVGVTPILSSSITSIVVFIDYITISSRNEELLFRYGQIIKAVQQPIFVIDRGMIVRNTNNAFLKLYDLPSSTGNKPLSKLVRYGHWENIYKCSLNNVFDGVEEKKAMWVDFGTKRSYLTFYYQPVYNRGSRINTVVVNIVDNTENRLLQEELKRISQTDPLTKIYNRSKFNDALEREIERIKRKYSDLSVLLFDIDFFKKINDTYGHDVGDDVLKKITALVSQNIRINDVFARWGGEEFIILLPLTDICNASLLADKLRVLISSHSMGKAGKISCSFGVSSYRMGEPIESFIKRADEGLYKSKRNGRNRVTISD